MSKRPERYRGKLLTVRSDVLRTLDPTVLGEEILMARELLEITGESRGRRGETMHETADWICEEQIHDAVVRVGKIVR